MALDLSAIQTVILGGIGLDLCVRIITFIRKGVSITTPMNKQLQEILGTAKDIQADQKCQKEDNKVMFELMAAVLASAKLTAKSLKGEQFNGDLTDASDIIDAAIAKLQEYVNKKAFSCE
jgi:hypothetical protein